MEYSVISRRLRRGCRQYRARRDQPLSDQVHLEIHSLEGARAESIGGLLPGRLVPEARDHDIETMELIDPVVRELQIRRLRAMSAQRKLEVADELLALARELKSSSLRSLYPQISEEELQARVSELFSHVAG